MNPNNAKYLVRLNRLTTRQLMALKRHVAADAGRKNAAFMAACIATVLMARVGLEA